MATERYVGKTTEL